MANKIPDPPTFVPPSQQSAQGPVPKPGEPIPLPDVPEPVVEPVVKKEPTVVPMRKDS